MVIGTLLVHSHDACVLFIQGSMHLYVSPTFAKCFSKPPARIEDPFLVTTLMEGTLIVKYDFLACQVYVGKKNTLDNLMVN